MGQGDSQAPAACSFLERQPKSKASLGKASPQQRHVQVVGA